MDMSNAPIGQIVASNIDPEPINNAIKARANALASEMPADVAGQFESDMSSLKCTVKGNGNSISFSLEPNESYLLGYLKSHGTPVSGGDDGTAHNVDGSTYQSAVPAQLQGTPLPWYELPTLDGEDEAVHILELMAQDAAENAVGNSSNEISEAVAPMIATEIQNMLGGG